MEVNGSDINHLIKKTFEQAIDNLAKDYEGSSLSDIYIIVDRESGEVAFYDNDENKVADIVVFDWVDNQELDNEDIASVLRNVTQQLDNENLFSPLDLFTPYKISYVDDSYTEIEELLVKDDESGIAFEDDLMSKFDREFDEFLDKLLKD